MFSKQALRRLILPLIIEQFLAVMVGMADIMMVSSAGEAAVSSVALVDLINVLIINIFAALATGGAVVCAQSIGAQNLERANRAANQLLYIVTAAALGIMVLVLFCKAGLLGLLFGQVEPEGWRGPSPTLSSPPSPIPSSPSTTAAPPCCGPWATPRPPCASPPT